MSEAKNDESELSQLLCAIDAAELAARNARGELLGLQHVYLEKVGFTIEQNRDCSFIHDYVYSRDDEIFLDVDHALEYAAE